VHAVVVHVARDADDLAPRIVHAFADLLADRGARAAPQLARQVVGHDRHVAKIVEVGPRKVPAGHERRAERLKITG
jgi:hypothetical protein